MHISLLAQERPGVPCQAPPPQLTSAQGLCSRHTAPLSSSTQQRKPLQQVHIAPDVSLHKIATKQSLPKNGRYKKEMTFCHPLQKFPLPGGDYFTLFTKAQKLPPPPLPAHVSRPAGMFSCTPTFVFPHMILQKHFSLLFSYTTFQSISVCRELHPCHKLMCVVNW